MPNIKSAIKRLRQSEKKNLYNRQIKSSLHTLKKKLVKLIEENKKPEAIALYNDYASALDKAARKSVIHLNRASQRKALVMQKLNAIK